MAEELFISKRRAFVIRYILAIAATIVAASSARLLLSGAFGTNWVAGLVVLFGSVAFVAALIVDLSSRWWNLRGVAFVAGSNKAYGVAGVAPPAKASEDLKRRKQTDATKH